ncbi:PTS sugar transporter subunit IIB [Agromyces sp. SYSU T00194]|uniref:PTS sugar transporter subunit IIB n=1 Tax=Agromyces chitinivorans TaxID=3158560 RepID=UPI0033936630
MRIVTVCGVGIGTSAILKANAERALDRLMLEADVTASDVDGVAVAAEDAQVILTSPELEARVREETAGIHAEIVVVRNYFDVDEIASLLESSIG